MKKSLGLSVALIFAAVVFSFPFFSGNMGKAELLTQAEDAEAPVLMTYEEYIDAELESPVCVEAYVQTAHKYREDYGAVSFYAHSEDGAYFVYHMPCTKEEAQALVPGTKVRITGYKQMWPEVNGEIEIGDARIEVIGGDPFFTEAEDVTDKVGTEDLVSRMNERVLFRSMTVVAQEDGESAVYYKNSVEKTGDIFFTAVRGDTEIEFCVESDMTDESTDVYAAVGTLQAGDVIDIEAYLYWYEGPNPQVLAITKAE